MGCGARATLHALHQHGVQVHGLGWEHGPLTASMVAAATGCYSHRKCTHPPSHPLLPIATFARSDLRANTEYSGFSATAPVIRWFWEAVSEMDKESLALLLQVGGGGL